MPDGVDARGAGQASIPLTDRRRATLPPLPPHRNSASAAIASRARIRSTYGQVFVDAELSRMSGPSNQRAGATRSIEDLLFRPMPSVLM